MKEEHIHKLIEKLGKQNKIEVPENLNEKLWSSFEEKISKKKSNVIFKWSAVASIALLLTFYVNYNYQKNQEELKKKALLKEVKSMFDEPSENFKINSVLFEDETLIVYTKTEN